MKHLLARSGTALLAVPLLLLVAQYSPTSVTATSAAPSVAVVAQARHNFIKEMSAHPTIASPGWISPGQEGTRLPAAANGTVTSFSSINWSGYGDSESGSDTVSYVSGSWTIPTVQCLPAPYQNQDAFLADWVGIDGLTDSTVEQLGTGVQCFEGVEYYYVWYEMFPAGTVEEGTTACINDNVDCPQPGDRITASVSVTPAGDGVNNYTLQLTDQTRPQESFSVTATCATSTCADSSAEWIVERPAFELSFGPQIVPLADFGTSFFSRADLVSGGRLSSSGNFRDGPVYDIPMTDDTLSYYLDCVDQHAPPGTQLLTTDTSACPTAAPSGNGGFETSWDSSW
jgi:Peptidase A4 family